MPNYLPKRSSKLYPLPASLASLHLMKERLYTAKKAEKMLSRKASHLHINQRRVAKAIFENGIQASEMMSEAFILISAAKFADGDFCSTVEESLPDEAHVQVKSRRDPTSSGAQKFESIQKGPEPFQLIGLGTAAYQLSLVRAAFSEIIEVLIDRVSLKNAFVAIEDDCKTTLRKANVIGKVTIPRIHNTVVYIRQDLDDQEREEMYKLSKIKAKKAEKLRKLAHSRQLQDKALDNVETEELFLECPVNNSVFLEHPSAFRNVLNTVYSFVESSCCMIRDYFRDFI